MSSKWKIMLLALVAGTACVDKGPPANKIDKAYVQANILSEAPPLDNVVNADFGGKVIYLGNTVNTKVLSPGGAGSIVHYWKVIEAPGASWKVFSHLNGGPSEWMNLDATDMRRGYPPAKWQAGQIIRDEQKFSLATTWTSITATMSVGLYKAGEQGANARMPIASGPHDAENRSPVYLFQVTKSAAKVGTQPSYRIRRADMPIVIDGKADEEAWKNAPMSPNFTTAEGGPAMDGATSARMLWDDSNLYIFVQMSDRDVYSQFTGRDDTLWKEDVIEFFIDADRNGRGYVELQVNPNNANFDAWFPQTRAQTHFFDWNSNMRSAVAVHGSKDNRADTDQGWDVEVAIPLVDVRGRDEKMPVQLPPALGDSWRMNIVRGDKPKDKGLAAASWNPITIQDFHALQRMLTVEFANAQGQLASPQPIDPSSASDASTESLDGAQVSEPEQPTKVNPPPPLRGTRNELRDMKLRAIKERELAKPKSDEERKLERMGR